MASSRHFVLFVAATFTSCAPVPAAGQSREVPLRSGQKTLDAQSTTDFLAQARQSAAGIHGLAAFRDAPTAVERQRLAARGITVLSRLTRYAYLVHARTVSSPGALQVGGRPPYFSTLTAQERVDPAVWSGQLRQYAFVDSAGVRRNFVQNADSSLNLLVRFHDDVSNVRAISILQSTTVSSRAIARRRWAVRVTLAQMQRLAANDLVRFIDALRPAGVADIDKVREEIGVNSLQSIDLPSGAVSGATGYGVRIGLYDNGVESSHPDFGSPSGASRIVVEHPLDSAHGTAMAGLIAGNGSHSDKLDSEGNANAGSPFQYRGIAPAAEIIAALWLNGGVGVPPQTLREHVTVHGMDISNHSYGLSADGYYGVLNEQHDNLIRGDDAGDGAPIPPRLHVHSVGNLARTWDGTLPLRSQRGYFSLNNQLKNALVAGNWYSGGARMHKASGLGPTYDGRIKPDVVAPGTFVVATGYCTDTDNDPYLATLGIDTLYPCGRDNQELPKRTNFYYEQMGASVAAAVTSGVLALVLQEISKRGVNLDVNPPLPSTLRGIAIHTADDIVADPAAPWPDTDEGLKVAPWSGPDFITGFGKVNAPAAVDVGRRGLYRQGVIAATCDTRTYNLFTSGLGPESVTVTLAWDDRASDRELSYEEPLLINDLDLVLVDPLGGRHYPWAVDQKIVERDDPPFGGRLLTDAEQTCGSRVAVLRQFKPRLPELAPSDSTPDDHIFNPVLQPVTGRDHLNTVEQVKTPAIAGVWKVQVSGFDVPQGPQSFSLIGLPNRAFLEVLPHTTCKLFPSFCNTQLKPLCVAAPALCEKSQYVALMNGAMSFSFTSSADRKVVPLVSLCLGLKPRGDCVNGSPSQERTMRSVRVSAMAPGLAATLYDDQGAMLTRIASLAQPTNLSLPQGPGELFLIVEPTGRVRPATQHTVRVSFSALP